MGQTPAPCFEEGTCEEPALLSHPEADPLTWEEAAEWWTDRPLVRFSSPPHGRKGGELVLAGSYRGGRKGRPEEPGSTLNVIYSYPPYTPDKAGLLTMIQEGGAIYVFLQILAKPPNELTDPDFPPKKVTIRGTPGQMLVSFRHPTDGDEEREGTWVGSSNYDRRQLYWQESDNPTVWYHAVVNSRTYSERDSVAILDGMEALH